MGMIWMGMLICVGIAVGWFLLLLLGGVLATIADLVAGIPGTVRELKRVARKHSWWTLFAITETILLFSDHLTAAIWIGFATWVITRKRHSQSR